MNEYTVRGSNSFIFSFTSHLIKGQFLKKRILFFKSRPYFERAALSRKANRKSQKLFPFVKVIENHGGVLTHLNYHNCPINGTFAAETANSLDLLCLHRPTCPNTF